MVLNLLSGTIPTSNYRPDSPKTFAFLTEQGAQRTAKKKRSYFLCANHLTPVIDSHFSIPASQQLYLTHPSSGPPLPRPVAFRVLPYLEAHLSLTSPTTANQLLLHYARSINRYSAGVPASTEPYRRFKPPRNTHLSVKGTIYISPSLSD